MAITNLNLISISVQMRQSLHLSTPRYHCVRMQVGQLHPAVILTLTLTLTSLLPSVQARQCMLPLTNANILFGNARVPTATEMESRRDNIHACNKECCDDGQFQTILHFSSFFFIVINTLTQISE